MFIAMNRFRVDPEREKDFEALWRGRESYLEDQPGFIAFHLLRGPTTDGFTLFASHTLWASRAAFDAWTRSAAFRNAHRHAGNHTGLYVGHPQFEGFDILQHLASDRASVMAATAGEAPSARAMTKSATKNDGVVDC